MSAFNPETFRHTHVDWLDRQAELNDNLGTLQGWFFGSWRSRGTTWSRISLVFEHGVVQYDGDLVPMDEYVLHRTDDT